MERKKLDNMNEGLNALLFEVDNVFDDRLYEFAHNLMLEAENKVETNWDTTDLQEGCDSGQMWFDEHRGDVLEYIWDRVRERI